MALGLERAAIRQGDVMSSTAATESDTRGLGFEDIVTNVRNLGPVVESHLSEMEQHRRLPEALVKELRTAGVFRAAMPADWGGPELTSMQQTRIVEEAARLDGSVGWCVMIGMDAGIYAGYLSPRVARTVFPRLDMITAGWVPPMGRAHEVEGGYRVDGHWRFGSGCTHADWIAGGCAVHRDGKPLLDERGRPVWRVILAEPSSFRIADTWHTTGLAGTGSYDYRTEGLFVPAKYSFSFDEPYRDGPLHRRSDSIVRKMSGVPLGVARAAVDYVRGLADNRKEQSGELWRNSRRIQVAIGECEMRLAVARSAVYSSIEAQWERLVANEPMSRQERATAALARYHAFRMARDVASILYDLVGGDAIYRQRTPLDRHLRDMTTACQHVVGQQRILEWSGQLLLGDDPDTPFI
jgi:alkylation response protein AidB-like acyl-CoA dehydrogenase